MSRLFVIFMIVLLPLRGWAGDLMSVQMATSGLAGHAASAMPPDCPMQLAPADALHPDDHAAQMEGCGSCDLCIPMAELAGAALGPVGFAAHEKPLMAGAGFSSASPAPTVKPPIS